MVKESQPLAKVVWAQEPYFLQLYMAHRSGLPCKDQLMPFVSAFCSF